MPFELMSEKCDQCLLSPQRIVSGARTAQILKDCRRRDVSFICHKTPAGREIICRGHFDTGVGQLGRIAGRLGAIVEIDPRTLRPVGAQSEDQTIMHKTKQAALKAAREALGPEAIEGVDFKITNTGAGFVHEEMGEGEPAAKGPNLKLVPTDELVSCSNAENSGKLIKMTPAEASAAGYVEAKDIGGNELWAKPDSPLLVDGVVYPNKTRATEARRLRDQPAAPAQSAVKAPKAPKAAKGPAKPKKAPTPKPAASTGRTKADMLIEMLTSPGGATSAEMETATGWQSHSVRGFLGTLRKNGVNVVSKKLPNEPTLYRIQAVAPAAETVGDVV